MILIQARCLVGSMCFKRFVLALVSPFGFFRAFVHRPSRLVFNLFQTSTMSNPQVSSPLRRLQTAVRDYCYPNSHPAVISFDILEEWSDLNLQVFNTCDFHPSCTVSAASLFSEIGCGVLCSQGEGNPQFRPAFGSDVSDRTPLAPKELNARPDPSNPVTTDATCEPAAGPGAKKVSVPRELQQLFFPLCYFLVI